MEGIIVLYPVNEHYTVVKNYGKMRYYFEAKIIQLGNFWFCSLIYENGIQINLKADTRIIGSKTFHKSNVQV